MVLELSAATRAQSDLIVAWSDALAKIRAAAAAPQTEAATTASGGKPVDTRGAIAAMSDLHPLFEQNTDTKQATEDKLINLLAGLKALLLHGSRAELAKYVSEMGAAYKVLSQADPAAAATAATLSLDGGGGGQQRHVGRVAVDGHDPGAKR
ncbi:MAG: hypothetical protein P4M00_07465 [Azospirillaceae bacterium]|nr:hypothetical protein [Azospirillaceae bacterium]